jgi:hypothetical protein
MTRYVRDKTQQRLLAVVAEKHGSVLLVDAEHPSCPLVCVPASAIIAGNRFEPVAGLINLCDISPRSRLLRTP